MVKLPPITLRLRGRKVVGRVAFGLLLLAAIAIGGTAGLLFVYSNDLPQIRALEDFRPNVVTELYADDGQIVGSFALQRRILLTYEQIPPVLKDAILTTEDQHFDEHWGVDFTRVAGAAWRNLIGSSRGRGRQYADHAAGRHSVSGPRGSQHAPQRFRKRCWPFRSSATTPSSRFSRCTAIRFISHGNYGFEAASEYYFGKPVGKLTLPEAALLAGLIRGPSYSPILHAQRALARRNVVLDRMYHVGKINQEQMRLASAQPMGLHVQAPRNTLAPYFVEEIRKYLESTYGTDTVHERGLARLHHAQCRHATRRQSVHSRRFARL